MDIKERIERVSTRNPRRLTARLYEEAQRCGDPLTIAASYVMGRDYRTASGEPPYPSMIKEWTLNPKEIDLVAGYVATYRSVEQFVDDVILPDTYDITSIMERIDDAVPYAHIIGTYQEIKRATKSGVVKEAIDQSRTMALPYSTNVITGKPHTIPEQRSKIESKIVEDLFQLSVFYAKFEIVIDSVLRFLNDYPLGITLSGYKTNMYIVRGWDIVGRITERVISKGNAYLISNGKDPVGELDTKDPRGVKGVLADAEQSKLDRLSIKRDTYKADFLAQIKGEKEG